MPVGRWAVLRDARDDDAARVPAEEAVAAVTTRMLARYGVVFRELTARERKRFPWRVLLHELRRREARGEVRGGRFVDGIIGESKSSTPS